jgi:hypothetical protein
MAATILLSRLIGLGLVLAAGAFGQLFPGVTIIPDSGDTIPGELRLRELRGSGSNYVGFTSPDTLAANVIWELPAADAVGCWQSDGALGLTIVSCAGTGQDFIPDADLTYDIGSTAFNWLDIHAKTIELVGGIGEGYFGINAWSGDPTARAFMVTQHLTVAGYGTSVGWDAMTDLIIGNTSNLYFRDNTGDVILNMRSYWAGSPDKQGSYDGDWVPETNETFTLGDPTNVWLEAHLGDVTIYDGYHIIPEAHIQSDLGELSTQWRYLYTGNAYIGTIHGGVWVADDLKPDATGTYDLGQPAEEWANAYIQNLTVSGTCTGCGSGLPITVDNTDLAVFDGTDAHVDLLAHNNTAVYAPAFDFQRTRGTAASPTVVQVDDRLGKLQFFGYHSGPGWGMGAFAETFVDAVDSNSVDAHWRFNTMNNGVATYNLSLHPDGSVVVGHYDDQAYRFYVHSGTTFLDGNVKVDGNIVPDTRDTDGLGSLTLPWFNLTANKVELAHTGEVTAWSFSRDATYLYLKDETATNRVTFSTAEAIFTSGIRPFTTATYNTGDSIARWATVYGVDGNFSDDVVVNDDVTAADVYTTHLHLTGNVYGDLIPNAAGTRDLGSLTLNWDNIYANHVDAATLDGFAVTGHITPDSTVLRSVGTSSLRFLNGHFQNIDAYTIVRVYQLEFKSGGWLDLQTNSPEIQGDLIPQLPGTYDVGSATDDWDRVHANGYHLDTTGGCSAGEYSIEYIGATSLGVCVNGTLKTITYD